jgi:hypothetical protein
LNRRITVLQTAASKSQPAKKQALTTPQEHRVQTKSKNSLKQASNQAQKLPADLVEVVAVWPELPEHIKAAIKALVQTHNTEK